MSLECAGTISPTKEKIPDVSKDSEFEHAIEVRPRKTGSKTLVVSFSSEEMIDINGSIKADVYN